MRKELAEQRDKHKFREIWLKSKDSEAEVSELPYPFFKDKILNDQWDIILLHAKPFFFHTDFIVGTPCLNLSLMLFAVGSVCT